MDPIEKSATPKITTLGDLISFYYDHFSEIYEADDLRTLAVSTVIDDLMNRAQDAK